MRAPRFTAFGILFALVACAEPQATTGGINRGTNEGLASPTSISRSTQQQPVSAITGIAAPTTEAANRFAVSFLNSIQQRSFDGRREYCGYFLVSPTGVISATTPIPGTLASCSSPFPPDNAFASYHTHGAYDAGYDNEVPSDVDLLGDFEFGLDGYVATPGGRIWHVEFDDRTARQVCGRGCVTSDPRFVAEDEAGIRASYTVNQIQARLRGR